jgi:phenylpyruvate tautomerase PptA (4-oxalocrotonate tautomerase family)
MTQPRPTTYDTRPDWQAESERWRAEARRLRALKAELVAALTQIVAVCEDNPNMTTNFIDEIARAALTKAKALQVGPDLAIGR